MKKNFLILLSLAALVEILIPLTIQIRKLMTIQFGQF